MIEDILYKNVIGASRFPNIPHRYRAAKGHMGSSFPFS